MLTIKRKHGEAVLLYNQETGEKIVLQVVPCPPYQGFPDPNAVRLRIKAPQNYRITRGELLPAGELAELLPRG